jgi:hypothetical protein
VAGYRVERGDGRARGVDHCGAGLGNAGNIVAAGPPIGMAMAALRRYGRVVEAAGPADQHEVEAVDPAAVGR